MDKVKINIQIGEFKHPLTIDREEEPMYREAAQLLNERLVAYRTKYRASNLSQEFVLSFAAFDFALRYVRLHRNVDVAPVEEVIQRLTSELEDFNQNR